MTQAATTSTAGEFVNVEQVARRYGVAPVTIWRWSRDCGDFPRPIKLGINSTRWSLADLERWELAKRGEA